MCVAWWRVVDCCELPGVLLHIFDILGWSTGFYWWCVLLVVCFIGGVFYWWRVLLVVCFIGGVFYLVACFIWWRVLFGGVFYWCGSVELWCGSVGMWKCDVRCVVCGSVVMGLVWWCVVFVYMWFVMLYVAC
jgi:hypothetical protein